MQFIVESKDGRVFREDAFDMCRQRPSFLCLSNKRVMFLVEPNQGLLYSQVNDMPVMTPSAAGLPFAMRSQRPCDRSSIWALPAQA